MLKEYTLFILGFVCLVGLYLTGANIYAQQVNLIFFIYPLITLFSAYFFYKLLRDEMFFKTHSNTIKGITIGLTLVFLVALSVGVFFLFGKMEPKTLYEPLAALFWGIGLVFVISIIIFIVEKYTTNNGNKSS